MPYINWYKVLTLVLCGLSVLVWVYVGIKLLWIYAYGY